MAFSDIFKSKSAGPSSSETDTAAHTEQAPEPSDPPIAAANSVEGSGSGSNDAPSLATPSSPSPLSMMTQHLLQDKPASNTDALNSQIVQAVQLTNSETAAYAPSQIAIAPNMMITQASGLIAQAGAVYFDSTSKMALASKSMLLKNMTEKLAKEDIKGAAEDALGILLNDLLVGTAAAVAAASGALEAESAAFALDKIDSSIAKYKANFS
jgi:hypothetical protein